MYKGKRFAALFMSMALATSMLPTNVLAADTADFVLEEQEKESQDTMPADAAQTESEADVKEQAAEETVNEADPSVTYQDGKMTVTWNTVGIADSYDVYRAESRYGTYTKIAMVDGETTYEDTNPNADKYANYYKIAVKEKSEMSAPASLEISMFGKDMYVFSTNDDVEQIYKAIDDVWYVQGGITGGQPSNAAQFSEGRYVFAFKSGDYSKMEEDNYNIGYYTQFLGLGKTPYDVTIKNVHSPALLPNENVTCNFWMGIENLSIVPKAASDTDDQIYDFKWSVSQAAPARRLYVQRPCRLNSFWDGWAMMAQSKAMQLIK